MVCSCASTLAIYTVHELFIYVVSVQTFLAEPGVEPAAEPVLLVPGGLAVTHHHNLVGLAHYESAVVYSAFKQRISEKSTTIRYRNTICSVSFAGKSRMI